MRKVCESNGLMPAAAALAALLMAAPSAAQLKNRAIQAETMVGGEVMLLTPHGPVPAELELKAGPAILVIQNRTGQEKLDVVLTKDEKYRKKADGSFPLDLKRTKHENGFWDRTILVDAEPGVYFLTVDGKESWSVKVTIKAN
jgi:hypothetical protein